MRRSRHQRTNVSNAKLKGLATQNHPSTPHEAIYGAGKSALKCLKCGHAKSLHQLGMNLSNRYEAGQCQFRQPGESSCECNRFGD